MAAIDDLIAQIEDQALRERLAVELRRITKEKKFGLVFEDHLPELTPIYSAKVRRHSKVALRDGPLLDLWRVLSVRDGEAHCRNIGSGETRRIPVDDLVVVRRFGEPIFPALTPVDRVRNGPEDAPWHTLIEADNYHALQLLEYLYAGQVDCIYIDPPYNTGARDWKYNNDYVDANDSWRHSKWLAFMRRRLKLAKRLLRPENSVLIVTIDEKEQFRLGLLLEELFPTAKIQMISSVISPGGVSREIEFTRVNEFIFFVMLGKAAPAKTVNDMLFTPRREPTENRSPIWRGLLRGGSGPLRKDSPTKFFPILVKPGTRRIVGVGDPLPLECSRDDYNPPHGLDVVWPLKSNGTEGRWELSRPTFDERLAKGYIRVGGFSEKNDQWTVYCPSTLV